MNPLLIQAVIDAADELIAAHDSTTCCIEPQVANLSSAVSALERAACDGASRSHHENVAAISACLHTHQSYERFYEAMADRLSGFTGIYSVCIAMADALTAWEIRAGGLVAYESLAVGWIEVVDAFVDSVLHHAINTGYIPDLAGTLGDLDIVRLDF